jgi:ferredoxin/putative sterol carrier protein
MNMTSDNKVVRLLENASATYSSMDIKKICFEEGVDDVGLVEIDRKELGHVREDVLRLYPKTKTIISICKRMNPENIQSISRSLANNEFHKTNDDLSTVSREIVGRLNKMGIRALYCHPGFPMDQYMLSGKLWEISHKPIAEQAGMGRTGINRNILHPKYGSFILLDSILIDSAVDEYDHPLDYNPCVSCQLCVSVCPVGAIHPDKPFDFNACMTHNYRDFMGGFEDWVQNIVSSKTVKEYKEKVPSDESISKWQSLSFGAQYKSAYCMAVCPAGEDLIGIYKEHRKEWVEQIVRPQKEKKEPVFVQQGTNAEVHARLNKNKEVRLVDNIIRPQSISGFLSGARITFEAKRAQSVNMTVHLAFTGKEARTATIVIKEGTIEVTDGLKEKADLRIECDSEQWLKIINKEISIFGVLKLLVTRRMRIKGNRKLLRKFQNVFV